MVSRNPSEFAPSSTPDPPSDPPRPPDPPQTPSAVPQVRTLRDATPFLQNPQSVLMEDKTIWIQPEEYEANLVSEIQWIAAQLAKKSHPRDMFESYQQAGKRAEYNLNRLRNGTFQNDRHSLVQVRLDYSSKKRPLFRQEGEEAPTKKTRTQADTPPTAQSLNPTPSRQVGPIPSTSTTPKAGCSQPPSASQSPNLSSRRSTPQLRPKLPRFCKVQRSVSQPEREVTPVSNPAATMPTRRPAPIQPQPSPSSVLRTPPPVYTPTPHTASIKEIPRREYGSQEPNSPPVTAKYLYKYFLSSHCDVCSKFFRVFVSIVKKLQNVLHVNL